MVFYHRCLFRILFFLFAFTFLFFNHFLFAQNASFNWSKDGLAYFKMVDGNLVRIEPKNDGKKIIIKKEAFIPVGKNIPLAIEQFQHSSDQTKWLLFINSTKVWRYNTRGDYWIFDMSKNKLRPIGKGLPSQSLMFAKFSPDGKYVAYVSDHNIYTEDVNTGTIRKITTDGTRKFINGTFDWVYEEEFGCRDGFRWSPDSKQIAFWQVDATKTRDFYMLNTTDSVYSKVIPVEYPKVGESPSSVRIGVISLTNNMIKWMKIEGDPRQHYIPRMEWSDANELIVQQLDRKQQESKIIYCNTLDGNTKTCWAETDDAWVDLNTDNPVGWHWINHQQDFLWISEKDGWRHIYQISKDGKNTTLLTNGDYDIGQIKAIDEANHFIYFTASPNNATQLYLYRIEYNRPNSEKPSVAELVGNNKLKGTHTYNISPTAKIAFHTFSNYNTPELNEWVTLPDAKPCTSEKSIIKNVQTDTTIKVEYLKLLTFDNVILDAWIRKPAHFDPAKKYPLVFYVYGEPGATTVDDVYGNHDNFLYNGNMSDDGYIQVAIDNRGTPSLRGAAWRKSIYRRNGQINIRDMAMGLKKILDFTYVDKSRVAVWGWSGGGSSTLHLLFQFPELIQTGISIAPVTNLLLYDNIYTERYMGLPQENIEDYIKGSAIQYAKNLQGNLLLIHGSGDDNVHYSNTESIINELVKANKQFQFMEYPNRTHSIAEGEGTRTHLSNLYTQYLKDHCVPGAR